MQGYSNSICFLPCFMLFFIIYECLLLFSHSVVFHSLRPHGLQHARLTCPSLSHCVCLNSCLLNQWCHPIISSSATHFSSCPQSVPASASFPMCWLLASGSRSTGASAAVVPMNAAAAAAKSLQSCPTLCDPIDGSPPGSPHPWDFPGKSTGVGCHCLLFYKLDGLFSSWGIFVRTFYVVINLVFFNIQRSNYNKYQCFTDKRNEI